MESNYVDLYHNVDNDTMTEQEGLELHGRDGVFCTSPLYTDIPLLTESQSVAEAINELFGQGTGANGAFRAVWDDNAGLLKIIVQEDDSYADYDFTYEIFNYVDSITTETTNGETVTTMTRDFSQRIITSLFNISGELLLSTEYNSNNGQILGYTDGKGEKVHTAEWRSEYEVGETQSPGAASAAVAWVIARNMEQANALDNAKKSYRKGLIDFAGDNTTEVIDDDGMTPFELVTDNNPNYIEKASERTFSMWYTVQDDANETYYVNIHTVESPGEKSSSTYKYVYAWQKILVYDVYNANGEIVSENTSIKCSYTAIATPANCWLYKPTYISYGYDAYNNIGYCSKLQLNNTGVIATHTKVSCDTGEVTYQFDYHTDFTGIGNFTTTKTTSAKPF